MMDDLFFNTMLDGHPKEVKEILVPIIGRDVNITEVRTQSTVSNLYGRAVRLDIEAYEIKQSKIAAAYDIEVENWEKDANPSRARYNHAALDTHVSNSGLKWDELPETFVILIYKKDYFKQGLPVYHIENVVLETGQQFDDKQHILYVNGSYHGNDKVGHLVHDMRCKNPDEMFNEILAERARQVKNDEKEINRMCEAMEKQRQIGLEEGRMEGRMEGRIEGRAEGLTEGRSKERRETALRMVTAGFSYETIAQCLGIPEEDVYNLLADSARENTL